jgi:hypothetical protein
MVERWRTELRDKLEVGSAPVHRVLRADVSDTLLLEHIRKEVFL